jgi:predicted adenine nucleotide alpha hydrolase (AANH) superfamily ATPase
MGSILDPTCLSPWYTTQIDFIIAYPQSEAECDIFMKIPKDFKIDGNTCKIYAMRQPESLYRQKLAGRVWNAHLQHHAGDGVEFDQGRQFPIL